MFYTNTSTDLIVDINAVADNDVITGVPNRRIDTRAPISLTVAYRELGNTSLAAAGITNFVRPSVTGRMPIDMQISTECWGPDQGLITFARFQSNSYGVPENWTLHIDYGNDGTVNQSRVYQSNAFGQPLYQTQTGNLVSFRVDDDPELIIVDFSPCKDVPPGVDGAGRQP